MKPKRPSRPSVYDGVEIHDHFDGSARCVECGSKCRLTGGNLVATELIRWKFEALAMGISGALIGLSETHTLERAGVDIEHFKKRAKETT